MGLFDFIYRDRLKQIQDKLATSWRDKAGQLPWQVMSAASAATPLYPNYNTMGFAKIYQTIDDVYSITNKIASKAAGIEFYAYIETKDESVAKFRKIRKHLPTQIQDAIKRKALADVSENDIVFDLINNPSTHLSKNEFYKAAGLFLLTQGEAIIYKNRLAEGVNAGKYRSMELLYPQYVTLQVTDGFPKQAVGYEYIINGKTLLSAPAEDIIHVKYGSLGLDSYGTDLRGLAPLKVAANRITRLRAGLDASVGQLQNGGIPSIVYMKDSGYNDDAQAVIDGHKDNFYRFMTDKANKGQPYFAVGEMASIMLGSTLADMDVAALADIDFDKLCNIWGVSSVNFNSKAASTESNVKEMRAAMYTDACIPLLQLLLDGMEKAFRNDFGKPYILQPDIQSIQELQTDSKALAETLASSPVMVPRYTLEALGLPFDEADEMLSKVYIKSGYQMLDDLQSIADLPI